MIRCACIFNAVQTLKLDQRGEQHRKDGINMRHPQSQTLNVEKSNPLNFKLEEREPRAKNWSVQKVSGCLYCRRQTSGKQRTMSGQLTAQETLEVKK